MAGQSNLFQGFGIGDRLAAEHERAVSGVVQYRAETGTWLQVADQTMRDLNGVRAIGTPALHDVRGGLHIAEEEGRRLSVCAVAAESFQLHERAHFVRMDWMDLLIIDRKQISRMRVCRNMAQDSGRR